MAAGINHSTIVRGLIGVRMLVSVYESTRIGCTEHTEASGRSRSLAGGACRRCRDRPDLCQPARTRTGGPERRGTRKTGARPLLKYRRVFQGAARRRGCAEAIEGRPTAGKIVPVIPGRASSREPGIQTGSAPLLDSGFAPSGGAKRRPLARPGMTTVSAPGSDTLFPRAE
jgi:hypothetical protein